MHQVGNFLLEETKTLTALVLNYVLQICQKQVNGEGVRVQYARRQLYYADR